MEYQEGSLAEHYEAVGIESRREVHAALTSWAYGEDGWHEAFTWTNSGLAVSTAED